MNIADYLMQGNRDQPIAGMAAIEKSRNQLVRKRSDLSKLVEKPLLLACEILYDKNIRTYSTSANQKDFGHGAYIILDYDTLSSENRRIAEQHGKVIAYDSGKAVKITLPITEATKVSELEAKSIGIAKQFKTQEATWIPSYSFKDMLLQVYAGPENAPSGHEFTIENFVKEWSMFYDEKGKRFYHSKEHFDKVAASHNMPRKV